MSGQALLVPPYLPAMLSSKVVTQNAAAIPRHVALACCGKLLLSDACASCCGTDRRGHGEGGNGFLRVVRLAKKASTACR